jgi:TonB family protein
MIEARTLDNLIAFLLQSSAVVAVALTALWILRIDAPGVRYGALRATLALVLALPFVQPRVSPAPALLSPFALQDESGMQPVPRGGAPIAPAAAGTTTQPAAFWASGLAMVLLAGVIGRFLWLSAGLWRLQRLRRLGETAAGEEHADLQKVIGTRAELRYVAGLGQPLTFGFRHPVVLLPDSLRSLAPAIQRAVVAHELWHVRRLDWPWMVAEEAIRSAFWFHPAMWMLLSRIQIAREETVDDLAILTTGSRRSYLDALLAFADARPIFAVAAFARRRHLLHRMLTISKENVMSSKRLVTSGAVLLVALAATAWSAAAAFPLTGDQNPPRDPRPAPTLQAEMVFVPASEADMEELIRREPKNPAHYRALAQFYLKAGNFDRAIGTLEALAQADPSNAQHHHQVAVFYWEKAFRDSTLSPDQKIVHILSGIAAADRALGIDPDYVEALIYKNILLRLQATHVTDIPQQRQLMAEADTLRTRAVELSKQRGAMPAGPRDPNAPPPPPPPPPPFGPLDGVMPVQIGGAIPPPMKIRDVRPAYPIEAQATGLSGVVVVELLIDAEGRVRSARPVRSAPAFDEAALGAVRQWQFKPTVIDGVARPVIMTVTVNFTLPGMENRE